MNNWHSQSVNSVLELFTVNGDEGLSISEIPKRRLQYGTNELFTVKKESSIRMLFRQFNNPIIYILIVAASINLLIAEVTDTLVICSVILLNTFIGFIQEQRAAGALNSLKKLTSPTARVLRDKAVYTVPANELVCGDILMLESGVRVPADCRLIDTYNLTIDESLLTGESLTVTKLHNTTIAESAIIGDRINMVFSGTIVVRGRGVAVVTAVGTKTEIGKISNNIIEAEITESPLEIQIAQFGKKLSVIIGIIILIIFCIGYLQGISAKDMLLTAIGLAVSAIPEGLPVSVTIALTVGVYKMARYKAVVRRLAAVETLGSTNIVCTDKTGTITKNQMFVKHLWINDKFYSFSGSGYETNGKCFDENESIISYNTLPDTDYALLIASTCTETSLQYNNDVFTFTGDPTEAALMIAGHKANFPITEWNTSVIIPFESEHRLMVALACNTLNERLTVVKGSPETLLPRCSSMIGNQGEILAITTEHLSGIAHSFAGQGFRVLALAFAQTQTNSTVELNTLAGLTFSGFVIIEDSIREEAVNAVHECHKAGVRVVMITGDHRQTAISIAKQAGIAGDNISSLTGVQIEELNDDNLRDAVQKTDVFARVAPHHKLRIVNALQQTGNIVAMTGDGVNDAPALKSADIGVAMGSGSDVAKEAADMVILDDNFSTIVQAIRRGRTIVQNLQHILLYVLSTSFGGILTIATSVFAGLHLPLLPVHLLWVNLVTDGTSTFPLAFEKEHGNVMLHKPRQKNSSLITALVIERIIVSGILMMVGTLGVFLYSHVYNDYSHQKSQTLAFCTLALFQIWNVQNSRSADRSLFFTFHKKNGNKLHNIGLGSNKLLMGIMCMALLLQLFAIHIPIMNDLLRTTPLTISEWALCFIVSFSIIIVVEVHKFIRRNR